MPWRPGLLAVLSCALQLEGLGEQPWQDSERQLSWQPDRLPGIGDGSQKAQSPGEAGAAEAQAAAKAAKAAGDQAKAQAAEQAMSVDDPRNVPGPYWPGKTAEESQSAWPAGQQPQSMAAWPVHDGKVSMCWKTEVLQDIHDGWPGQCVGLNLVQAPQQKKCENSCLNDPRCPVWQFNPGQTQGGCWQGQGFKCDSRNGMSSVDFSGGQRLQHGSIRVLKELRRIEIRHLRDLGFLGGKDEAENIGNCRLICYSDILCQYWLYGNTGCKVEDPTYAFVEYPLTMGIGATMRSSYAESVVAGQFIQHYCPPRGEQIQTVVVSKGEPDPLGEFAGWRIVPYIILTVLVLMFLSLLGFFVRDYQKEMPQMPLPEIGEDASSPTFTSRAEPQLYDWRSNFPNLPMQQRQAPLASQLAALPSMLLSQRQTLVSDAVRLGSSPSGTEPTTSNHAATPMAQVQVAPMFNVPSGGAYPAYSTR